MRLRTKVWIGIIALWLQVIGTQLAFASDFRAGKVIDGDTIHLQSDVLPIELKELHLRINGIDTPEKAPKAKCVKEAAKAAEAADYMRTLITNANNIEVNIHGWDKYGGRVLGDLVIDGHLASEMMIAKGFAVKYNGTGKKTNWCK